VLFAAHYFFYKARSVDERWVEERTSDLRSKSYDASHIDTIAGRAKPSAAGEARPPRAANGPGNAPPR
jgi:hypothetical protein